MCHGVSPDGTSQHVNKCNDIFGADVDSGLGYDGCQEKSRRLGFEIIWRVAKIGRAFSQLRNCSKFKLTTHYPIETTVAGLYVPTLIKASCTSSVVLML